MNISNSGIEQIIEKIVSSESPSIMPYKASTIVMARMNNRITITIILQITLQGDDLEANATHLGGGDSGAITACISLADSTH